LLIVDDCPTDGNHTLAEYLAKEDARIRSLSIDENSGVATARNLALNHAKGNFICYLDHDDEYYPEYLTFVAKNMQRADVLVFRYYDIHQRDESSFQ
jgi:glycosyltransferase involved in cell wall biosynthesis